MRKTWPTSCRMDQAHCELFSFVGAHTVNSSGCRLQLPRSSVSLKFQKYLKCSHGSDFRNALLGGSSL